MWELPDRFFLAAATVLFWIVCLPVWIFLARGRRLPHSFILSGLSLGFVLHTTGIYMRGYSLGACPLGNPFEILHFIAWSLVLLYLLVGTLFRVSLLGSFTAGMAAILGLLAFAVPGWDAPRFEPLFGGDPIVELHASLAVFSYGAFALLALVSAMFILQDYGLRTKQHHPIYQFLPALEKLDQLGLRLIGFGLLVLTPALAAGALSLAREANSVTVIKLLSTTGIWAAYLSVLLLRLRERLTARSFSWLALILFGVALFVLWPVEGSRFLTTAVFGRLLANASWMS